MDHRFNYNPNMFNPEFQGYGPADQYQPGQGDLMFANPSLFTQSQRKPATMSYGLGERIPMGENTGSVPDLSPIASMATGAVSMANPAMMGAELGLGALNTGVTTYLKWKEMKDQEARQKKLDEQADFENSLNLKEHMQDRPGQRSSAALANEMQKMNYLDYLAKRS